MTKFGFYYFMKEITKFIFLLSLFVKIITPKLRKIGPKKDFEMSVS